MAQPPEFSAKHLFELIKTRKIKEFRPYLQEIENQTPEAERAVSTVLRQVLVQKKIKDPAVMFNTLIFYKHLLVSATMDYICIEDIFPQEIHRELQNIVSYKPEINDITIKAKTYFKDIIGADISQANSQFGFNYILFASEILSAMSKWYPSDYDDDSKKSKSIFKQMYDELVKKGISLPQEKDFQIMKEADQKKFKENYASFLQLQKEQGEEEKSPQTKDKNVKVETKVTQSEVKPPPLKPQEKPISSSSVKPQQKPNNTLNIGNRSINEMINKQKQELHKNVQHQLPLSKIPEKGQSKLSEDVAGKRSEMVQQKPKENISKQNERQTSIKESDPTNLPKLDDPLRSKYHTESSQQAVNQSDPNSLPNLKDPLISRLDGNALNIENAFMLHLKKSYEERDLKPSISKNVKKQKQREEPIKKDEINDPMKRSQKMGDSNIREPLPSNLESPNKQQLKRIKTDSQDCFKPEENHPKQEFQKKQLKKQPQRFQNNHLDIESQPIEISVNEYKKMTMTPKKWPRVEKPSHQTSPQNIDSQYNIQHRHNAQNAHQSPSKMLRPRSLPKTQKRKWQQFPTNFKYSSKVQQKKYMDYPLDLFSGVSQSYEPNLDHQRDIFNKTLSYFATSRKKMSTPASHLEKYYTLACLIEKMRLDRTSLPFHVRYFQPITLAMTSLRDQSLNLFNSGVNPNPFYFSKNIQARLLKEGDSTYFLSLHNISGDKLTVNYSDLQSMKYSKRVKILSWGNQPEITQVLVNKSGYLDIKFQFETYDLNFQFLPFTIVVNEKQEHLVLPITLLDMCQITGQIEMNSLQKYAQKGSILASEPFGLKDSGLPHFLGDFKFSELTARKQRSLLIGQCMVQFQRSIRDDPTVTNLYIMVKLIDQSSKKAVIEIIYLTKDGESLNLAKVLMYLLLFLLNGANG